MCATTFTTAFVSAVNSFVGTAFMLGVKLFLRQQSPGRIMVSVATFICQEGIKLRVNAWVTKQRKRREELVSSLKKFSNSCWWSKKKKSQPHSQYTIAGLKGDFIATEVAFKFQALAEKRLRLAMASFKAAEYELREAERGLEEAKKYAQLVQSHCKTLDGSQSNSDADIVLVEHDVE